MNCNNKDLECINIILDEICQVKKDRYHMISLICGIKKKTTKNKGTKEIKQNQTRRHRKKICDYQKIRGLGVHVMGEGGQLYGG